jgi:predicted TIM-barrel fold metal-dependent hydrolase
MDAPVLQRGVVIMASERILSADSHVAIRDDAVLRHLPQKYHDAYGQARMAYIQRLMARAKPKPGEEGGGLPIGSQERPWEAAGRPGEHDPVERLKDMDTDGVEAEVLYSDVEAGVSFNSMEDGGRVAAFRAFNDAALEFASHDPKRLLTVYLIPIVDVAEAVGEVERLARESARAFMLPLYPTDLELAPYFDPKYDPLWGAIQDTGIPISQHVGANEALWQILRYDTTPAKGIFQSLPPMYMSEVLANWIVGGVFERFPKLRVVLVEAGLGWIPFFLERLDTMKTRHGWDTYGMLKELPSFYFKRNMMATFEEDTYGVSQRHHLGVENLMWATDYPHPDSTWPNSQKVLETHFSDVPGDEARLMIGGNAARLYQL